MSAADSAMPTCPPSALGDVPGGWAERTIELAGRTITIALPADPDAFLEDSATLAEHERSEYMPYWPYLWPAVIATADLVRRANWPPQRRVLEIGCGIGLAGLAAALRGDAVTFSDYREEAVALALHNAARNGCDNCRGMHVDWRDPPEERFDVILGCEVIYERRNHAPVLDLVQGMLAPGGLCWIGDPGRHQVELFLADAASRGFNVSLLDSQGQPAAGIVPGEFRLIELR